MKRAFTVLLAGTLMLGLMAPSASAGWRNNECRYRSLNGSQDWSNREEKLTARCLAKKFKVSVDTTLYVISRESGWYRFAVNRSSGAKGLMQHIERYFCGRLATAKQMKPALKPYGGGCNWRNPRQNIAAGMALVRKSGWHHWTVL
jgi:hypothetical protein